MSIRLISGLLVAGLLALTSASANGANFRHGHWLGTSLNSDDGQFVGCNIATQIADNTYFQVIVSSGGSFNIALSNTNWNLRTGTNLSGAISVDRSRSVSLSGEITSPIMMAYELAETGKFQKLFASGKRLYFASGDLRAEINLEGSRVALGKLRSCLLEGLRVSPSLAKKDFETDWRFISVPPDIQFRMPANWVQSEPDAYEKSVPKLTDALAPPYNLTLGHRSSDGIIIGVVEVAVAGGIQTSFTQLKLQEINNEPVLKRRDLLRALSLNHKASVVQESRVLDYLIVDWKGTELDNLGGLWALVHRYKFLHTKTKETYSVIDVALWRSGRNVGFRLSHRSSAGFLSDIVNAVLNSIEIAPARKSDRLEVAVRTKTHRLSPGINLNIPHDWIPPRAEEDAAMKSFAKSLQANQVMGSAKTNQAPDNRAAKKRDQIQNSIRQPQRLLKLSKVTKAGIIEAGVSVESIPSENPIVRRLRTQRVVEAIRDSPQEHKNILEANDISHKQSKLVTLGALGAQLSGWHPTTIEKTGDLLSFVNRYSWTITHPRKETFHATEAKVYFKGQALRVSVWYSELFPKMKNVAGMILTSLRAEPSRR